MKKGVVAAVVAAIVATVAAVQVRGSDAAPQQGAASAVSCTGVRVAVMAPITGPAASIGKEQRNWARLAVSDYNANRRGGVLVKLVEHDTQLDPAQASTQAQRIASAPLTLAVVGPAGSQEVIAAGPIFRRSSIAYISPSATATNLTTGRYPTFFRVVGNDNAQALTDAQYAVRNLRKRRIVAIDDQTSYGKPLADEFARQARRLGARVSRQSVPRTQTDFSALVTSIAADTDLVFLAWQIASNAQVFAQQMREQGKNATIFGSDGLFSPDFKIAGAYVSAFAPDIKVLPGSRATANRYRRRYGNFGTFGPPVYVATQAAINAIVNACENGNATRNEVLAWVRRTSIPNTILGRSVSFTPRGDVRNATFFIFRFTGGTLKYIKVR